MNLTHATIRERLAHPRHPSKYGDLNIALKLANADNVIPFDPQQHAAGSFVAPMPRPAKLSLVPAAVLVPLVEHADGFTIILTQRMADLKAHAGQISFPGGRMEPEDRDAEAGALREAHEEVGLAPSTVEILGQLDPYVTVTGFEVTPVVGAITPPLSLKPDPREVADIFEVPLAFILDRANHQRHSRTTAGGIKRAYYALPYGDRYIWGATAGMLINLYEVLTSVP